MAPGPCGVSGSAKEGWDGAAVVGMTISVGLRSGDGALGAEVAALGLNPDGGGINEPPPEFNGAGFASRGAGTKLPEFFRSRGAEGGGGRNGELSEAVAGSSTMMAGTNPTRPPSSSTRKYELLVEMTLRGVPSLRTRSAVAEPRGILRKKVALGITVSTHCPGR